MEKIQLKTLFSFLTVFEKIKDERGSIKTSYKIAKFLKALNDEKENYIKVLQDIINEYGEKDENGKVKVSEDQQTVPIIPEKREECYQKISELEETEIEFSLPSFTLDELSTFNLSIEDLSIIDILISE